MRPPRAGGFTVEFDGEFETHVTVRAADADAVRAWAARHRLKFLHIVLDRGDTVSQPMVTRRATGTLAEQMTAAADLSRRLDAEGFAVTRVKIEAAPGNRDVPQTDAEAIDRHRGRYFEHHVKLALDPTADLSALVTLARRHAAHLSRNARRRRDDGKQERFVTQRCAGVGQAVARRRLTDLLEDLAAEGYVAHDVEEEFVVYDSNLGVDTGWLDGE